MVDRSEFSILYRVPLIAQQTWASCWSAALLMIKQAAPFLQSHACTAQDVEDSWQNNEFECMEFKTGPYGEGLNMDAPNLETFARINGLVNLPPQDYVKQPGQLYQLLDLHGPLFIGGRLPLARHAYVLVGMRGGGNVEDTEYLILNPWPPGIGARQVARYTGTSNWPIWDSPEVTLDDDDIRWILYNQQTNIG